MAAIPIRPDVSVLTGASQAHATRTSRWRGALARLANLGATVPQVAIRRLAAWLSVTIAGVRPYALTVGSLACFVVCGFVIAPALGWAVAGVCGLWFNHGLQHRE